MLGQRLRRWPNNESHLMNVQCLRESPPAQQTQDICITFIQRRPKRLRRRSNIA